MAGSEKLKDKKETKNTVVQAEERKLEQQKVKKCLMKEEK